MDEFGEPLQAGFENSVVVFCPLRESIRRLKTYAKNIQIMNIIDNGPGIDSRDLERIFYPMISGRPDGSGLGLSITQHIISEHNGVIQVSSTFGQTIFSIFLPFEQPAEEAGQQERK